MSLPEGREHRAGGLVKLASLVLILATALPALAAPPVQELPGRPKDSKEPWGAFLGKAAHHAIAIAYRNTHPGKIIFSNTERIANIVEQGRVGTVSNLKECEKDLCPDITDVTDHVVFEIKPDHTEGLEEGKVQVRQYVDVLNKATSSNPLFTKGRDFSGSVFVHLLEPQQKPPQDAG